MVMFGLRKQAMGQHDWNMGVFRRSHQEMFAIYHIGVQTEILQDHPNPLFLGKFKSNIQKSVPND